MIQSARIVVALGIASVAVSKQPRSDERNRGPQGAMSLEQLRRKPIRFKPDTPRCHLSFQTRPRMIESKPAPLYTCDHSLFQVAIHVAKRHSQFAEVAHFI